MDIFKAKFSDFKSFHTLLYTCAKEFDFLGWEMPEKTTKSVLNSCPYLYECKELYPCLSRTLLLPSAALACILVTWQLLKHVVREVTPLPEKTTEDNDEKKVAWAILCDVVSLC